MHFAFTPYSHYFLVAILLSLTALLVIQLRANFPGKKWIVLAMLAITFWNLCAMLDISSTTLPSRILWSKIEYLGANTTAPLLLLFFFNYPSALFRLKKFQYALLFFIPVITIAAAMTNEWHYLFWTGFTSLPAIPNGYEFHHGFFYWLALAFNYSCGTFAFVRIAKNIVQFRGVYRLQSITLLSVSIFPFVAGLAYSLNSNPFPGLDILPLAFSLSGAGIVVSVAFLRLFDLVPVGRSMLVENMQDGLIVVNQSLQVVDINPAARRLLEPIRLNVGESIAKAGDVLASHFVKTGPRIEIEWRSDPAHHLELTTSPLIDPLGNQVGTMGILRDITDICAMRQRLLDMATHDPLTGLPNRSLFYDHFNLALANARRDHKKFSILYLDLDRYKSVNDNMGHLVGDEVLIEVAVRLRSSLRAGDTVARFGGDEFAILLWDINDRSDAIQVSEKLLNALRKPFQLIDGGQVNMSASIGIVLCPDHGTEMRELMKRCDEALYRAKEKGRNTYSCTPLRNTNP